MPHFLVVVIPVLFFVLTAAQWTLIVKNRNGSFNLLHWVLVPTLYVAYGFAAVGFYYFLSKAYFYGSTKVGQKLDVEFWSIFIVSAILLLVVVLVPKIVKPKKKP